jgi:hypothetical protein
MTEQSVGKKKKPTGRPPGGGGRGGTGRPSNALRTRCQAYLAKATSWRGVDQILQFGQQSADYLETMKWLADRGYGKAVESVELSGPGQQPLRIVYDDE